MGYIFRDIAHYCFGYYSKDELIINKGYIRLYPLLTIYFRKLTSILQYKLLRYPTQYYCQLLYA